MAIVQCHFIAPNFNDGPSAPLHEIVFSDHTNDAIACMDLETGHTYTRKQLEDMSKSMAHRLRDDYGVGIGDVVASYHENCAETLTIIFGTTAAGAAWTGINAISTVEEVHRQLADCSAKILITSSGLLKNVDTVGQMLPKDQIKAIFIVDELKERIIDVQSVFKLFSTFQPNFPAVDIDPNKDTAFLAYSSGTTGLPKGAMLSHKGVASFWGNPREPMGFRWENGKWTVCVLPFFHLAGFGTIITALRRGTSIAIMHRFDGTRYLEAIQEFKVEDLLLVPSMLNFLAKSELVQKYDLSSLKRIYFGAAPAGDELLRQVKQKLPLLQTMVHVYGMTEMGITNIQPHLPLGRVPAASIGLPVQGVQIKVVSTDGSSRMLGIHEIGEICAKSPQMMTKYLNKPQATRETMDADGWIHTGDIGYFDEGGYFYICDRLKELVKYKGYQVAPAELEDIILKHDAVDECAVTGIPHPDNPGDGELPTAFVLLKPSKSPSARIQKEIVDLVAAHAAPYKRLRGGVRFLHELPKGSTGKVLRRLLRTEADKYTLALKSKL